MVSFLDNLGRGMWYQMFFAPSDFKPADAWRAAKEGDLASLQMIVQRGDWDPDCLDNLHIDTILTTAVIHNQCAVVDFLCSLPPAKRPDLNGRSSSTSTFFSGSYHTPCHTPCHTPLTMAAQLGYIDIARVLLNYGADGSATDNEGHSALFWAVSESRVEMVKYFLSLPPDKRPNVNLASKYGETAISNAFRNNRIEIIRLLLPLKPKLNTVDTSGDTIVHYAAMSRSSDESLRIIFELDFAQEGLNLNQQNLYGNTAFHYACHHTHGLSHVALSYFLALPKEKQPDLNIQNSQGKTALHYLCETDYNLENVKALLAHFPKLLADKNGDKPIDVARKNNCSRIVALLEAYSIMMKG